MFAVTQMLPHDTPERRVTKSGPDELDTSVLGYSGRLAPLDKSGRGMAIWYASSSRFRATLPHPACVLSRWRTMPCLTDTSAGRMSTISDTTRSYVKQVIENIEMMAAESVSRILSATDVAGRSFLWAAHYCAAQATYPKVWRTEPARVPPLP